jgi:hypothetical protein
MGIALIASLINIVQLQRSSKRAVERVRHRATRDEIPAFVSTRSA